ncbi:hypothetical protein MJG53_005367 [Ovis ammon polii x Ovis aries]|uniref:Uncharacterized protein n=1 Tax=Ovis ammon polii x Ovis aries TaxID=2918886 RepID=A0ACB9VDR6_9CETA|nr:hypothetical protein MJG53_005367 [Ovis ammon polii x Ovis aries]
MVRGARQPQQPRSRLAPRLTGTVEKPPRKRKSRTEFALKEIMSSGGAEDDIPQGERKTVTDFCYLLDKSKQLFNGLRDLPQYGQKQWQSYFGRTFDVYTKLWKFQQQHRPELVVKKLRYYARFIVVCLLLNKMDVVKDLVKELSDEIEDYTHRFNTEDQVEWNLVLQEVAAFIEADPVMVLNDDNTIVITSNRLAETGAPLLEQGMIVGQLSLADALIIGNCNNQVKFSELTVDMFRMLQALEREPMNLASQMNKPGMQELPANSVLLIYLSATGVFPTGRSDSEGPYDFGGVLTNSNRDIINGDAIHKRNQSHKEMHCLHPGDLYPFTRKPLFIIVDSSNSVAYKVPYYYNCTLNKMYYPGLKLFKLFDVMVFVEDQAFLQFFGDEFLRLLLTRFIFCSATMRMHKIFRETRNYPESYPQLPRDETVENPHLQKHILELASILDVRNVFLENTIDDY